MVLIIDHSSQFHFMALALLLALPSHLDPQQKERRYDEEQNIEEGIIVKITRIDVILKIIFRQNNNLLLIGVTCLHGGRLSNMYDGGPALLDIRE